ncbi:MAG: glycoside hydrolase family 30 protein [bacterium]|nr:glycoside hydrolase family 30 protein [bacterium]MCP4799119.1 glycoside hydrolase family 30 protein [bacterium]
MDNIGFQSGTATGNTITIQPENIKQTIDGIGTSFTESSAFVLAHLEPSERRAVMNQIFSKEGANFSIARTHIASCDFTVEGKYSYADVPSDINLDNFSIQPDIDGFDTAKYPGIKDPDYDLLPMIKEALAIKSEQRDSSLNIISSAWTAPYWMKDIEDWYISASEENNWAGTGGALKPEYIKTYSDYLVKYIEAYAEQGVAIWGLTPVNEPHGNNGSWESMNFSPESQNEFIKQHLGPALKTSPYNDTRILIFDQNRDGLEHWADVIFGDKQTAPFVYGAAIHWYESTNMVYEDAIDRVHSKFPQFSIIHTEGCIDNLGNDGPPESKNPALHKESNWFNNDSFWWNENATDWAFESPWIGEDVKNHPIYTPVHRYARNIIVSLDHWVTGWIDWNIVLDSIGGPNHVDNFCGAPIMIDTDTELVYYTPIYYVLSQLSRTIRPGDKAVQTQKHLPGLDDDTLHTCATINADKLLSVQLLNTSKDVVTVNLQIKKSYAEISIPANSVQTVRVQL